MRKKKFLCGLVVNLTKSMDSCSDSSIHYIKSKTIFNTQHNSLFYGHFHLLRRFWLAGSHTSLFHITRSCTSTSFSTYSFWYPYPPPDSMSSLTFLYFSCRQPHTACFSSPSRHCLSVTHVPDTSADYSLTNPVTGSIPIHTLSSTLGALSFRDTTHIHRSILICLHSDHPIRSVFMAQVSLPYTNALLTHVTYTFPFNFSDISLLSRSLIAL